MLGDLDKDVQEYGGVINTDVVVAAARGVVESKNRSLLVEHGGSIAIEKSWAKSLLVRMNFVKHKGSSAAKLPSSEFELVKQSYQLRIKEAVFENGIVPQMILNMDQTAIHLIPASSWTMEERGKTKIIIKGIEDKREITALLAVTLSGGLLPPQLLYQGKPDRCHPHITFPADWDVFHTNNHWSNTSTVLRFIDKVIIPYLNAKHLELELPISQKALLIMKAHRTTEVLQKLSESNIIPIYVPPNCTDRLQPLDLSVNRPLKNEMRKKFVKWYSKSVTEEVDSGKPVNQVQAGLQMSI